MIREEKFIDKAKALEPVLHETVVYPLEQKDALLGTGDKIILDFGNHYTGYLTFDLGYEGRHPDAPVWMKISFAEQKWEFEEDIESYQGWISKGWVQQEQIHVDVVPSTIALERRYALRYVCVEILDCSQGFKVRVEHPRLRAVSSADDRKLRPFVFQPSAEWKQCHSEMQLKELTKRVKRMDEVACHTLHECMQRVFEDGPKRDRRLWIGDLRLEALANYETYQQQDLVKRCLYLFAGDRMDSGLVAANLFLDPEIEADNQAMLDYSLFFVTTLRDYVEETEDEETLQDLYDIAMEQLEIMETYFDENHVIRDSKEFGWTFIDWNLELNRQASAQGICLYALQAGMSLARLMADETMRKKWEMSYKNKKQAAREHFLDRDLGFFVSGAEQQCSWASQCWMIIGGAVAPQEGADILKAIQKRDAEYGDVQAMVTPYMYHHYVEALVQCGEMEKALEVMLDYWGGMLDLGADTFWELYNPKNPKESPYGGTIVNSYCHAWSCAPTYFLRKYYAEEK